MKTLLKSKNLPFVVLALGVIGFALRWLLYAVAVDAKNLIPMGHPLEIAIWLVAAAAVVVAVVGVKKMDEAELSVNPLSIGKLNALGCILLAVGILVTVLGDGISLNGLEMVRDVLGVLSVAAMVAAAVSRNRGQEPLFLFHAVVCVFFAVYMVSSYRGWSSNPQLQDYVFTLFACIALMLFAYYQAACAAGCGSRRLLHFAGLMAVFACIVCLSGTDNGILYLTGGIWALTNLTLPAPTPAEECDDGTA